MRNMSTTFFLIAARKPLLRTVPFFVEPIFDNVVATIKVFSFDISIHFDSAKIQIISEKS